MEQEVSHKFTGKYKLSRILAKQKQLASESDINIQIKAKEGQIKTEQKRIENNQKEVEKLNDLLQKNEEVSDQALNEKLEELNKILSQQQAEIDELKKMREKHFKFCDKKISSLKSQLNVLNNDIELEKKMTDMIDSENTKKKSPDKLNKSDIKDDRPKTPEKIKYALRVREKFLKDSIKNRSRDNINKFRAFNYFSKDLEEKENIEKSERLKTSANFDPAALKQIKSRLNISSPSNYLFSKKEKELMSKLIPEDCLNSYNERYNQVETEIKKIEEETKKGNKDMKKDIEKEKFNIEALSLKIKEENMKNAKKISIRNKNKMKIFELKKQMKELEKVFNKEKAILDKKTKDNENYQKRIEELEQRKKKKKDNDMPKEKEIKNGKKEGKTPKNKNKIHVVEGDNVEYDEENGEENGEEYDGEYGEENDGEYGRENGEESYGEYGGDMPNKKKIISKK